MLSIFTNLEALLNKAWQTEPARVISAVTGAALFVATNFGFVVQETSVTTAVTILLGVLFSGEVVRSKVSPASPPTPPTSAS